MPIIKCQFFYQTNKWGWSETHYVQQNSLLTALHECEQALTTRYGMMGSSGRVKYIRVSDPLIRGDARVKVINEFFIQGKSADPSDIPTTALILRFECSDTMRRTQYLRGFPDIIVANGGQYIPSAGFATSFTAWKNFMINGNTFGLRGLDRSAVETPIANVVTAGGVTTVTTGAPHGLANLSFVRITKAFPLNSVNGVWRINVTGASAFTLLGPAPVNSWLSGGLVQARIYTFLPYQKIEIVGPGRRDTGRPIDSPVGRRRRRAS